MDETIHQFGATSPQGWADVMSGLMRVTQEEAAGRRHLDTVDPEVRELLERTRLELDRQSIAGTGHPLDQLQLVEVYKRDFSLVLILIAETGEVRRKLVLKKVVHHPVNIAMTKSHNQAVVEFEILRQLYPHFEPLQECAVPCPVAVFPDEEAFVMEYVKGDLLSKQLDAARHWGLPSQFKELERSYFRLGQWLKHFQSCTGIEYGGSEVCAGILERYESRFKIVADCPTMMCSEGFVPRMLDYVKGQISTLRVDAIPVAGRHGDFGDWNILVNQDGVTVFDFLGYARDPTIYDVLKVLTRLHSLKSNPLYSHHRIDRLEHQFLEGYGAMPSTPVPVLIVCEIYHKICMVGGCISNRSVRPDYAVWNRRLLTQGAEFVRELERVVSGNGTYVPSFLEALTG